MQPPEPRPTDLDQVPEARISERSGVLPFVWILPIVAAIVGGWLLYKTYSEKGPEIVIEFPSARGLVEGKTTVRYRNVQVGLVKGIEFSEDLSLVRVTAELSPDMADHLTDTTRFWVVRPRLEATQVSGLETLLSGSYIAMEPSTEGRQQRVFTGLSVPPRLTHDVEGTEYTLTATELGSLSIGSQVYHRDFPVGEVLETSLPLGRHAAEVRIFVRAPYDGEVNNSTRFWRLSAVEFGLDADGVNFRVESLAALLGGGIAFQTPEELLGSPRASERHSFVLHSSRTQADEESVVRTRPYLFYFDESVRGLQVGAPVDFRGLRIGTVKEISVEVNPIEKTVRIPVLVHMEPDRFKVPHGVLPDTDDERQEVSDQIVEAFVSRGMRAQLQTSNILTGQLYIAMDFLPFAAPREVDYTGPIPILPTAPGSLSAIRSDLISLLGKLNSLPIEQIGRDLEAAVAGLRDITTASEIDETLLAVRDLTVDARATLGTVRGELVPAMRNVNAGSADARRLIGDARQAIEVLTTTLGAIEGVTDRNSAMGSQLYKALAEMAAAAQAIRIMAEYLERHPEALISGKR